MNKYRTASGTSIIMMIVGMSPIIFSVIIRVVSENENIETYTVPVSWFLGGLLCVLVADKGLNIKFRNYFHKPDSKLLILVILSAFFYEIFIQYAVYGETSEETSAMLTKSDIFPVTELIFIAPVSEELVFRFAMLTVLIISSGTNKLKLSFSIVFTSLLWVLPHFSGLSLRSIDIAITGIIIGAIYLLSKNLLYCITFHASANFVVALCTMFGRFFYERGYLMYIGLFMSILFLSIMFAMLYKNKNLYSFQTAETVRKIH